jgi:hypothetical protein
MLIVRTMQVQVRRLTYFLDSVIGLLVYKTCVLVYNLSNNDVN